MKRLLLFILLAASCRMHARAGYPRPVVEREGYAVQEVARGEFIVWSLNGNFDVPKKEMLKCGVCAEEPYGEVHQIIVLSKKK